MNRRLFFKSMLSDSAPGNPPVPERERAPATRMMQVAGSPRQYHPGDMVLITSARAWLGCDEVGFYAVDAICPHLGCLINQIDQGQFVCAGHDSHFLLDGQRQYGPASANLRYLLVDLDEEGQLVIRRDQTMHPADRLIA